MSASLGVKHEPNPNKVLQGHLDTYRFCDEVWTFIIKDVKFKLDNTNNVEAEKVKIVACQSKEKAQ